ncbi:MAG TPA: ABC transporter permease [Bdellovibrionota bacterium]|nr:ABC transporter permease [Bdellovibrionota bacterium]
MTAYIVRRTLYVIPILLGVALITFIVFHVAGGDPVLQMLGKHATAEEAALYRHEYGFDQPLPLQFLRFLRQIVTLDFERSFQTKQTIGKMLADGAEASLSLAVPAFLMSEILAISIALIAAALRRTILDRLIVVLSVLGMSVSVLAYILLGQYFLAFKFNLFPISGYEPEWSHRFNYLALPWIIWILLAIGSDVRFFRTIFLEELGQDYVRTAHAKGLGPLRVLFSHVLRNAMVPIVTRLVIEIPFLFMGSLLLENFFGIPGLGSMTVDAFNNADWPVVKAITVLGAILYVFGNLFSDILYAKVDPRVVLE